MQDLRQNQAHREVGGAPIRRLLPALALDFGQTRHVGERGRPNAERAT
jgi:hypothetical protein